MDKTEKILPSEGEQPWIFRRPDPRDETDRIGRELVKRMMEAGVIEPK